MNIIEDLKWREILKDVTNMQKLEKAIKEKSPLYLGFDATADNLHIGSLLPLTVLKRFKNYGHQTYALVGNATGCVGDPSGKKNERDLQSFEKIQTNSLSIATIINDIAKPTEIVYNYDWWKDISALQLLTEIGKKFNVKHMLSRDIVSTRINSGISFTEFSYQVLQGYDFLNLYRKNGVQIQVGGSDQWGNIVSGTELIKKEYGESSNAVGITINLITKQDGTKFGKTEGGVIWLKNNSYKLYQYLWNVNDSEVIRYLKYFTFLTKTEIEAIEKLHSQKPWERMAQKILAKEVLLIVGGEAGLNRALNVSTALFSNNLDTLTSEERYELIKSLNVLTLEEETNILDLLVNQKIAKSKTEARMLIADKNLYLNGTELIHLDLSLNKNNSFYTIGTLNYWFIKKGKRNWYCLSK